MQIITQHRMNMITMVILSKPLIRTAILKLPNLIRDSVWYPLSPTVRVKNHSSPMTLSAIWLSRLTQMVLLLIILMIIWTGFWLPYLHQVLKQHTPTIITAMLHPLVIIWIVLLNLHMMQWITILRLQCLMAALLSMNTMPFAELLKQQMAKAIL